MNIIAHIITLINIPLNALGRTLLAPVAVLPGWLSNTIISAVVGVFLLVIFKYTSDQRAIGRVRDNIKANMLALKLFKDSVLVTLQSQGQVFKGAWLLLFHAIRPMLVMIVPVSLILAQMGLWYQARPIQPGEQVLVIMKLNDNIGSVWPEVSIVSTTAAQVTTGPVHAFSKHEIFWKIKADKPGLHRIIFQVGQQQVEKELAIGTGFMRISARRPGWHWEDILLNPSEKPFRPDSIVQSISVNYPERPSRTSGTDWWIIYFFAASMVFALLFKPFLNVRI